jgi:antitoxin HigA-1
MIPKHRAPTTPGEVLREEFLEPMGVSQTQLAERCGIPIQRINAVANGRREVTAETAVLLARALKTTPEFWMNLQMACDLYAAQRKLAAGE